MKFALPNRGARRIQQVPVRVAGIDEPAGFTMGIAIQRGPNVEARARAGPQISARKQRGLKRAIAGGAQYAMCIREEPFNGHDKPRQDCRWCKRADVVHESKDRSAFP